MLVSYPNDVKIYNLSAGKSIPEWITDRKKRKLLQDDVDLRRRIELIQDFDMPDCSNCVTISRNGQYIYACGTYKPRVKCFDVSNLSMKFERCVDAEPIKALVLSEGYEKVIFLEEERWVEFHVQYGKYFRLRIPKAGRDIAYNETNCDFYVTGSGNEIYRLNLEQGRFMTPFTTKASSLTKCDLNTEHQLLAVGTYDGIVEAWDSRCKNCAGTLDTSLALVLENYRFKEMPSTTCVKFKDGLHLAVGTATGQILLYDIRSNRPYLIKDHNCDLAISAIDFNREMDLVLSMDKRVLKLWYEQDQGKPYTSVEPGVDLNDLCLIKDTGLFFLANEGQKILTYYIPSLGPAPRWCSFLDSITEELEETDQPEVYDDYKFLTTEELDQLGLSHLIGSKLLRAYMHGYFIDARLYNKAKALTNPMAYQEYRKNKIREQLDKERSSRVQIKKLPAVNKELAERLTNEEQSDLSQLKSSKKQKAKTKAQSAKSLLEDTRFKALFENPEFEVDKATEEYKLLNPAMAKLEKQKAKKKQNLHNFVLTGDEDKDLESDEDTGPDLGENSAASTSSSEDDLDFKERCRQVHKEMKNHKRKKRDGASGNSHNGETPECNRHSDNDITDDTFKRLSIGSSDKQKKSAGKTFEIKEMEDDFQTWAKELSKPKPAVVNKNESLESRLNKESMKNFDETSFDHLTNSKEMTFASRKMLKAEEKERKLAEHIRDRRKLRRSTASLNQKKRRRK